jgi:DNA-binding response OmpR family regulator
LIVADEAQSELLRGPLEQRRYEVESQSDFGNAYQRLTVSEFDLVVIDLADAPAGIEFVKQVRAMTNLTRTLLLVLVEWGTGGATLALSQGADAYEPKPLKTSRLLASVERLLGGRIALAQGATGPE